MLIKLNETAILILIWSLNNNTIPAVPKCDVPTLHLYLLLLPSQYNGAERQGPTVAGIEN